MHTIHTARHLRVAGGAPVIRVMTAAATGAELRIAQISGSNAVLPVGVTPAKKKLGDKI
jgi:hypothetical protein